ncbi:MAG: photosystem reaction center subunit H [Methanosphaera stadtmanae]|jgi:sporulation protein YlmC with PRC-barrel domain|nr:photosystem reaction center subunit H [Methanosphaera stadtmanae]
MRILDDIISKEILDNTGNIIGKIKDIEIDTASNCIESLIITEGGFDKKLGRKQEEIIIPFEMIGSIGDKVIIKKEKSKLEEILEQKI